MQIFGIVSNRPQRNWTIALVLLCAVGAMSLPVSEPNYTVASVTTNNTNTTIRYYSSASEDRVTLIPKRSRLSPRPIIPSLAPHVGHLRRRNTTTSTTKKPPFRIKLQQKPHRRTSTTAKPTVLAHLKLAKPQKPLITSANYTRIQVLTTRRPSTIKKWPHRPASLSEIKQAWYGDPTPSPQISSHSPSYSISQVLNSNDDSVAAVEAAPSAPSAPTDLTNAISTFNLDMRPADISSIGTKQSSGSVADTICPTVHISSAVLTPQQRQECSDLNLVINSHFHQNPGDRTPGNVGSNDLGTSGFETYQAPGIEEAVDPVVEAADPAVDAAAAPLQSAPAEGVATPLQSGPGAVGGAAEPAAGAAQSAPAAGAGGPGGSAGSGGSGGSGGDGGGSSWEWPSLKGFTDFCDWVWNKSGWLRNPYLYIVPVVFYFLVGFLKVIVFFPWWIPAFLLWAVTKGSKTSNIVQYKHQHKPVHHTDGWFYNHQTKSWQNVLHARPSHSHHYRPPENYPIYRRARWKQ